MRHLLADLRLATRSLARAPLFTVVAVVSIALGIGANTAVFSLLDQVTLRPLPVARASELVQIHARGTESVGGGMGNGTELSWPMLLDLQARAKSVHGIIGRVSTSLHVTQNGVSERADGDLVSGNFFEVLGIGPAVGRLFSPADDRTPGGHPVVVLGYDYWQRRFAGKPDVVGRAVTVNGHPLTVIGVAARGFYGLELGTPSDLYVPLTMQPQMGPAWLTLDSRRFRWVQIFARLDPGVTAEQAQARVQPLFTTILQDEARDAAFGNTSPETQSRFLAARVTVMSAAQGAGELSRQLAPSLRILMAVAAGVLLIACANVANLLIARGAARERELALRRALGAGRGQLAWLLAAEAGVLALAGSVVGLVLAAWGAGLLVDMFATADAPVAVSASPDVRIVAFTAAIAFVTAMIAGLAPALRAARGGVVAALKSAGGGVVREQPRLRKTLVVVQVGLSFLMLATAGLFVRSLDNLRQIHPGFTPDLVTSFTVDLERSGYTEPRSAIFGRELLTRLAAVPGVESAGFATFGLLEGGGWGMGLTIEGFTPKPGEDASSMLNAVSPGFMEALRMRIVRGRALTPQDARTPLEGEDWPYRTAVINETFAARYFPGRDPIGRHIGIGDHPGATTPITVVGVSGDAKYMGVREAARPQVFVAALENRGLGNITVYVRSALPPPVVLGGIRRVVSGLDPGLPVFNVATLDERVSRSLRNERLLAGLSAAFATLATLLAMVGLYGVMAYTVSKRSRDIGIRMALGARASMVASHVVREAGFLILAGLGLSLPVTWWLGRYVRAELYQIEPADPMTLAAAALGLIAVGVAAAAIPARRAARVDPMTALRDE